MAEAENPKPTEELPSLAPTPGETEGVRRQREHIKELDGEDPQRGGVAD